MKLGYTTDDSKPSAIALSGGAGYAWLTSDNGTACYDRDPQRKSRFRWRNDAVPAIAHTVALTLTLTAATPVGICAVLGLANVPAGVQVKLFGKRAGDAGATWDFGGQNTATVVQFADGTFGAWFVLPDGAAAVTQVAFTFYNNKGGLTWATAATTVDVGELVALPAVEMIMQRDWRFLPPGTSDRSSRTRGSALASVRGVDYRRLGIPLDAAAVGVVRDGDLANGMDWYRLQAAIAGLSRVVAIPRGANNGAYDLDEVNKTAVYGVCAAQGEIAHVGGDNYTWALTIEEVPAI